MGPSSSSLTYSCSQCTHPTCHLEKRLWSHSGRRASSGVWWVGRHTQCSFHNLFPGTQVPPLVPHWLSTTGLQSSWLLIQLFWPLLTSCLPKNFSDACNLAVMLASSWSLSTHLQAMLVSCLLTAKHLTLKMNQMSLVLTHHIA